MNEAIVRRRILQWGDIDVRRLTTWNEFFDQRAE